MDSINNMIDELKKTVIKQRRRIEFSPDISREERQSLESKLALPKNQRDENGFQFCHDTSEYRAKKKEVGL